MENKALQRGTYNEGYAACQQFIGDATMIHNPYPLGSIEFKSWQAGWDAALKCLPVLAY